MGWFLRKSFRLLPGVRLSVSKSGPRLSVGVLGARASVGLDGKVRIFCGRGPLRYQKRLNLSPRQSRGTDEGSVPANSRRPLS